MPVDKRGSNENGRVAKVLYLNQNLFYIKKQQSVIGCVNQGSVVQSIVSLTSSLRGQLVKYFMTL